MNEKVFNNLVQHIIKWEGGYSNNPNDTGGETVKGVTYNTYKSLSKTVLGVEPSHAHFLTLTEADIKKFILSFWNAVRASEIKNTLVASFLTEMAWGSGPGTAIKILQQTLKEYYGFSSLEVDGRIGPATLKAVNSVKQENLLFDRLFAEREEFLKNIVKNNPSQQVFLKGWLNRTQDFFNNRGLFISSVGAVGIVLIAGITIWALNK